MIRSIPPQDPPRSAQPAGAGRITARVPHPRILAAILGLLPLSGCALFQDPQDTPSIVPPSTTTDTSQAGSGAQAPGAPGTVSNAPGQAGTAGNAQVGQPAGAPVPTTDSAQPQGSQPQAQWTPADPPANAAAAGQPAGGASAGVDPNEAAHAVPVASSQTAPAPAMRSPLSLAPSAAEAAAAQASGAAGTPGVPGAAGAPGNGGVAGVAPAAAGVAPYPGAPTGPGAPAGAAAAEGVAPGAAPGGVAVGVPGGVPGGAVQPGAAVAPAATQAMPLGPPGVAGPAAVAPAMPGAAGMGAQIPGPVAVPDSPGAHRHISVADQLFAREAAQDALAELDAAQIAQGQAQSASVKQYAARVADDYGKARQMLLALAGVRDDPDNAALDPAHQRALEQLSKLRGEGFDASYVRSELAAHQKSAELYEWILGTGRDPGVKGYAVGVLPTVLQELETAQSLLVQMSPPSE